jgi:hypothetical protein
MNSRHVFALASLLTLLSVLSHRGLRGVLAYWLRRSLDKQFAITMRRVIR